MICQKKTNLLICGHVDRFQICRFFLPKQKNDRSTDEQMTDFIFRDTLVCFVYSMLLFNGLGTRIRAWDHNTTYSGEIRVKWLWLWPSETIVLSRKCCRHVGDMSSRHKMLLQFWPDGPVSPTQDLRCRGLLCRLQPTLNIPAKTQVRM